ncbi:phage protein Gp37 [Ursidibacter arcticus]
MITKIELALIERLKRGLGKLASDVASYGGEFDDEHLNVRRLPCVLVSYGSSRLEAKSMSSRGGRFESVDTFAVLVLARSMRSNASGRHGGVNEREIGVNQLIFAVKYLLANQTLGGLVKPIKPVRVRTLWNNQQVKAERLSAYAVEFEISYTDLPALEDGVFPVGSSDRDHPEWLFGHYQGELENTVMLERISGVVYDPSSQVKVDIVVEAKDESKSG